MSLLWIAIWCPAIHTFLSNAVGIIYILPTVMTPPLQNKITHLYRFFHVWPCLGHTLIIFRIYVIKNKLDFVSFDDKNLQRRRKFIEEGDFSKQTLIRIKFNSAKRYYSNCNFHFSQFFVRLATLALQIYTYYNW